MSIDLLLRLSSESLSIVKEDKEYKWNGFLCDKSGATFYAIEDVLSASYLAKTVACQLHFWECARKQLGSINDIDEETFKGMYSRLFYADTASECKQIKKQLSRYMRETMLPNSRTYGKKEGIILCLSSGTSALVTWILLKLDTP